MCSVAKQGHSSHTEKISVGNYSIDTVLAYSEACDRNRRPILTVLADAFADIRLKASEAAGQAGTGRSPLSRELDQRQRQILSLFERSKYVTTREIAELLGIHPRTALNQCNKWVSEEFVIQRGDANKLRKYEIADRWLALIS